MIIKEAVQETCDKCGHKKAISRATVQCDSCGSQWAFGEKSSLDVTAFNDWADDPRPRTVRYYFCSWRCVFERLPEIEADHFIDLPMLTDDADEGQRIADFWDAMLDIDQKAV